uniref:transglutaminase domain-containing protein n=1 Tax=Flavobacterium sp. TaxID=239 RepID=UPI004048F3BA
MKNLLFILGSFLFSQFVFSQDFKLGKVTVDELQKTHSTIDSAAAAEVMFKNGSYTVMVDSEGYFVLKVEVDTKIKIFSKDGYDWANYQFPVYTGGKRVQASYSNAYTYNLVDGKVEKTKLKKEGEFTEEINENYELRKIKMPNVKEGSIVEFTYTYKTVYFRSFPEWFFQQEIPVLASHLKVTTPEFYQFNIHLKPYLDIERTDKMISWDSRFKSVVATYNAKDVPAFKDEAFVTNVNNFISSIRYEMRSYRNPSTGSYENYANTWEDVSKNIYESDYFGKELSMKGYYEEDLANYITENSQKYDKTEAVYNFVKERMNWNEYQGKFVDLGVKKAYKERVGNAADINLMLVAMLRSQGIKANPVITSTRNNGIAFFPNVAAYNYVLAAVEVDNGYFLYDATSKNASAQIIPIRALNWFGRMVYENGKSLEVNMMPVQISKSVINAMFEIKTDGSVSGKYREQMTDYNAFLYRENYGALTEESNMERIEKKYNNLEVVDITLKNAKDVYEPIFEEVTFNKPNAVDVIGDKIYFSPMFMFGIKTNPFKSDKREFPIDFVFPNEDKYMISIKIPDGYEIESMPESIVLEFEEDMLGYKYQLKRQGNTIQISQTFSINTSLIQSSIYSFVKDFFTKVVEKNKEQIVLKKI